MKKLLVALLVIFAFANCNYEYSEGVRFGMVDKFSKRGFICKSWEGQLVMEGVRGGYKTGSTSRGFSFSVKDESVAQQLETLVGQEVKLHYKEIKFRSPCSTDTGHIVFKVEKK